MSAGKVESGQVPKKGPGEYREGLNRASAGKAEIRASTEKVEFGRVLENHQTIRG